MMKWLKRVWVAMFGAATMPEPEDRPDRLTAQPGPYITTGVKISRQALAKAAAKPAGRDRAEAFRELFPIPEVPHWIKNEAKRAAIAHANDAFVDEFYGFASLGSFGEGIGFLGYPYLAELTQRAEYRMISEIRAEEMTRKWIELTYDGSDKKGQDRIKELNKAMESFQLRAAFRKALEQDGFFGRAQIYMDTGVTNDLPELQLPLKLDKRKFFRGSLKAFRTVESIWTYPNTYNSNDPLRADFFRPQTWFIQGKLVHATRLLTFVSREVPDLLKPSYAFGGLSLSQMAKPYVDNWLRTRQSVSDLLHAFSIMVLATKMGNTLQGQDGEDLFNRIDFFNALRDNRGTFVIDKDTEDFKNVAVPLGTLDALQAQSQEQMASVSQTPLVKLLGITPSGLNASSDGEIRVYYDGIHSKQERVMRAPLFIAIQALQLHLWGEIDPAIGFEFVPLWQLDEAAQASVDKTEADIDIQYVQEGVLDVEEVRNQIVAKKGSRYAGINPDEIPEPPDQGDDDTSILPDPAKSAEPKNQERSGV